MSFKTASGNYVDCFYYIEGSIIACSGKIKCLHVECPQHLKYGVVDDEKHEVTVMQKYVGKIVFGEKKGRFSHQGRLVKVFMKGGRCTYQIKEKNGQIGNFIHIQVAYHLN